MEIREKATLSLFAVAALTAFVAAILSVFA